MGHMKKVCIASHLLILGFLTGVARHNRALYFQRAVFPPNTPFPRVGTDDCSGPLPQPFVLFREIVEPLTAFFSHKPSPHRAMGSKLEDLL